MTFTRDPLSVRFDGAAHEIISRAIRFPGKTVLGSIDSGPGEPVDDGGLTRSERAFQRALYHDQRIRKPRRNSGGPWTLPQPDWLARTGRTRLVRIMVVSDISGAVYARARIPRDGQWQHNDALKAGWQTPAQRFPG